MKIVNYKSNYKIIITGEITFVKKHLKMKHLISISLFAMLITNLGYSQKIGNILEKAKSIKDGAEKLNNNVQNLQENFLYTHNTATDRVWKTTSKVYETYCGVSQEKTRAYSLEQTLDDGYQLFPGEFIVGTHCVTETSGNSLTGSQYSILLTISKNEKEIIIVRSYSEKIKKEKPDFGGHPAVLIFTLGDSIVLCKGSSTLEKYKSKNYDIIEDNFATFKSNSLSKGEGEIIFGNSQIYQLSEYSNWNCSYRGDKNQVMKLLLFQIFISYEKLAFAKYLNDYDTEQKNEIKEKNQREFVLLSKECTYCNTHYTGVSYDFEPYRSTKNPCGDNINPVYYYAFCSRKCALEHCKATHP